MLMRHPKGGWHNADAMEVSAMEKTGWIRSCPEEQQAAIAAKHAPISTEEGDEITALRAQWTAKHGKPPHHKKSADTLRRELE